jgi:tetratricopeptide (TPR) repeat protein
MARLKMALGFGKGLLTSIAHCMGSGGLAGMKKSASGTRKSTSKAPEPRESARGRHAPPPPAPDQQRVKFEQAIALFQRGDFPAARAAFEGALAGDSREMAHAARIHMRMCEQRIARNTPQPASAEERYNFAVALINRRELGLAERHLAEALGAADGDHLHYAMALCLGLKGDLDGAGKHLRRAIELEPRNRLAALNDPDFREFVHHPTLRQVLAP